MSTNAEPEEKSGPSVPSTALLPCPFCGSQPYRYHFLEDKFMLRCDDPFCPIAPQTIQCDTEAGCAALWNMRKPDPPAIQPSAFSL